METQKEIAREIDALRRARREKSLVATICFPIGFPESLDERVGIAKRIAEGLNKWNTNGGAYSLFTATTDFMLAEGASILYGVGPDKIEIRAKGDLNLAEISRKLSNEGIREYLESLAAQSRSKRFKEYIFRMMQGEISSDTGIRQGELPNTYKNYRGISNAELEERRMIEAGHGEEDVYCTGRSVLV